MARVHGLRVAGPRSGARPFPAQQHDRPRAPLRRVPAVQRDDRVPQHDTRLAAAELSGRSRDRAAHRGVYPLERDGDGRAGEPPQFGIRRPHRVLRFGGHAIRGGLQSFLARQRRRPARRSRLHAGSCVARHLCARVPRGPPDRGAAQSLPPGSRRRRPVVVSASVADAGLLAVPDRLDGARPDAGDLPGALSALPRASRHGRHRRPQGVGVPRRRRDGRARVAGRDHAAGARGARQPDLRDQLQPAAARRAGARQRQDHPGTRGRVPRRRLERHQGRLGFPLGPVAGSRR